MNKYVKMIFALLAAIVFIGALTGCPDATTVDIEDDGGTREDPLAFVLAEAPLMSFDINNPPEPAVWNAGGEILNLPNPFQFANGTLVSNFTQWAPEDPNAPDPTPDVIDTRREEIKKIVQHYEYGYMPPPPEHMEFQIYAGASGTNPWVVDTTTTGRIVVNVWRGSYASYAAAPEGERATFNVNYTIPTVAQAAPTPYANGPYPAYTGTGYQTFGWGNFNMPIGEGGYSTGIIGRLFPNFTGGGTVEGWAVDLNAPSSLMCSAWGVSRVIDAMEWARDNIFVPAGTTRYIDPTKLMVTGTSRGGKQALVAGAFAESQSGTKIAVTFPNASGSLGTSIERFLSPVLNNKMDYYFNLNSSDGPAPVGVTMVAIKDTMIQGTDYDVKYTLGKDAKGIGLDQGFQTQHHAWTDSGGYWPSYRNKQFLPMRTDLNIDKEGGRGYLGTLPYDQHFVMSLVAPRGLLVTCGILDYWNNPESNFLGFLAVREVYKFLDRERAFGLRFFNVAHSGNSLKQAEVVEFANAYLAGVDPDTLKDPAVFGTKSKYRQLDIFPLNDKRSYTDYVKMYWKAPNSTEPTMREQILALIAAEEAAE